MSRIAGWPLVLYDEMPKQPDTRSQSFTKCLVTTVVFLFAVEPETLNAERKLPLCALTYQSQRGEHAQNAPVMRGRSLQLKAHILVNPSLMNPLTVRENGVEHMNYSR